MSVTAVGTPAAPAVVTTGSVTGSWSGTQPRTAGDLLVAAVTAAAATSTTAISTPAGWTKQVEIANGNTTARTAFYTLPAAGGDAAPNFTSTLTGTTPQMTCELWELAGANTSSPVDTSGTATVLNTSQTTLTVTTTGNVLQAGEYALSAWCFRGAAQSITWTPGASWTNQGTDGGASIPHAAFDFQAGPASGAALSELGTSSASESNWAAIIIVIAAAATAAASSTGYPLAAPGRLSPPTIGLAARPVQAPQSPPTGQATPVESLTPPGLQSPTALGLGLTAPSPAPQSPAQASSTGYPLTPPGRTSPVSLGLGLTAPSPAPQTPASRQATEYPLTPPGRQSPVSLGLGLTAPSPAPQSPPAGQATPVTALVPPGMLSPMALSAYLPPGSPAPPAVPAPPPGPTYAALTPPGLASPMAIGLPLYAPSPGPGPQPTPAAVVVTLALAGMLDRRPGYLKKRVLFGV